MRKLIENEICHAPYIETFLHKLNEKYLYIEGAQPGRKAPPHSKARELLD